MRPSEAGSRRVAVECDVDVDNDFNRKCRRLLGYADGRGTAAGAKTGAGVLRMVRGARWRVVMPAARRTRPVRPGRVCVRVRAGGHAGMRGVIAVHGARVNATDVGQRGDEPNAPDCNEGAIPEWTLHE